MSNDYLTIDLRNSFGAEVLVDIEGFTHLAQSIESYLNLVFNSSGLREDVDGMPSVVLIIAAAERGSMLIRFRTGLSAMDTGLLKDRLALANDAWDIIEKLYKLATCVAVGCGAFAWVHGSETDQKKLSLSEDKLVEMIASSNETRKSLDRLISSIHATTADQAFIYAPSAPDCRILPTNSNSLSLVGSAAKPIDTNLFRDFEGTLTLDGTELKVKGTGPAASDMDDEPWLFGEAATDEGNVKVLVRWKSMKPIPQAGEAVTVSGILSPPRLVGDQRLLGHLPLVAHEVQALLVVQAQVTVLRE